MARRDLEAMTEEELARRRSSFIDRMVLAERSGRWKEAKAAYAEAYDIDAETQRRKVAEVQHLKAA